jgi:hypothetical protein
VHRQRRLRPAGITTAAAITTAASPSAPPAADSATVRASRSGGAGRVMDTWEARPPPTVPVPPSVSTAVTAWTGFTMPLPVPGPAAPSAVALIRATTCAARSDGKRERTSATTPETNAVAKLVPLSPGL